MTIVLNEVGNKVVVSFGFTSGRAYKVESVNKYGNAMVKNDNGFEQEIESEFFHVVFE